MGSEILEIGIQTLALLMYGGVPIFSFVQSQQSSDIKLFVVILGSNAITTGILWILYGIDALQCRGATFECIIFVNDALYDFFYILYPLTLNHTTLPLFNTKRLALLKVTGTLIFSVIFALILLAKKVRSITAKFDIKRILANPEYIKNHNLQLTPFLKYGKHPETEKCYKTKTFKKLLLTMVGIMFIIYGVVIVSTVFSYLNKYQDICNDPTTEILVDHPELHYYQYCENKVYPLNRNINGDIVPCDCKIFKLDVDSTVVYDTNFNAKHINYIMSRWTNLEVFEIMKNYEDPNNTYINLTNIKAKNLRVMEIRDFSNWCHIPL